MSAPPPAVVDTSEEAAALSLPPLLVLRPLAAVLDDAGIGSGSLEVAPIGDGHSNVTYLVRRGQTKVVLRRPPRPPLPPSAHDVVREATLLRALAGHYSRLPTVLLTCTDEAVIGAPFYVMEHLDGDVLIDAIPSRFAAPARRREIGRELVDALAELHAVDWRACGLEDFAPPTGYLPRQLRRFGELWERNRTRDVPVLDRVTEWLWQKAPVSRETTVIHGDYRLGNAIFAPGTPARLSAVLDWELATLGDPLADVGYLLANWPAPGQPRDPMNDLSRLASEPDMPTRDELLARYEEVSGRSLQDIDWYRVLAVWKSAIFLEGSYRRYRDGTTSDDFFARLGEGVPAIADRAWRMVCGDE